MYEHIGLYSLVFGILVVFTLAFSFRLSLNSPIYIRLVTFCLALCWFAGVIWPCQLGSSVGKSTFETCPRQFLKVTVLDDLSMESPYSIKVDIPH